MVRGIKGVSYGLLCFLAGAALMLLVGANGAQEAPVGRYQVAATNTGSVVVDTQTGHLWARSDISPVSYDLGTPDHPICEIVQP
jgi:hypothetical protein